MNKRFFINALVLLFSFSAFAVQPNARQNNIKRTPIASHTKKETPSKVQTNDIASDKQHIEKPTFGESWSKLICLKWTSLSKDDVWNISASLATCGVIAYVYAHIPRGPTTNKAIDNPNNKQGPNNANKNHIPKPTHVNSSSSTTQTERTCDICFEDKTAHEFCTLSCCGHNASCTDCLIERINGPLQEKTTEGIQCTNAHGNCTVPISEQDIRTITHAHPEVYKNYHDIAAQEWLAKNTKHCPTPDCSFAFVNDEEDQQSFTCPQCRHTYCSSCLKTHSMKMTCAQAAEDLKITGNKTRAEQEDEKWKREHSKKCPQCKASIEKNNGCNHMTCKCHHEFCWECLSRWKTCNCAWFPAVPDNNGQQNIGWNMNNHVENINGLHNANNGLHDINGFLNGFNGLLDILNSGLQPNPPVQIHNNRPNNPVQNTGNQNIRNNGNVNANPNANRPRNNNANANRPRVNANANRGKTAQGARKK